MKSVLLLSNHQKSILSMPVVTDKLAVLGAPPSAQGGSRLQGTNPPAPPACRGQPRLRCCHAGCCRHDGVSAHPLLSSALLQQGSFLSRKISVLFSVTSKNGVSFHLPEQLRRAAAGAGQQGEASCRDALSHGKKLVPQGQAFNGIPKDPSVGLPKLLHQHAPPCLAIQQTGYTTVRDGILKTRAKLPRFSLHRCVLLAPRRACWAPLGQRRGSAPLQNGRCVHTVCDHHREQRYRDVPAPNTAHDGHG